MKLELGSGQRPTPGYIHSDINPFPGIDQVCPAWEVTGGPYAEVVALGVIEHLTYPQAISTFTHIHDLLAPAGVFLFDVPDFAVWADYLITGTDLFDTLHVQSTLHGWRRWTGDEHKSSWTYPLLTSALSAYSIVNFGVHHFADRGLTRDRMTRKGDAHIYVQATR